MQLIQKVQFRGAEIFASQLSNHLTDRGHEVVMMALFLGDVQLPFKGTIGIINEEGHKSLFSICKELADRIHRIQPDVVQANAGETLKIAAISRLIFGWKAKLVFRNANKISDFMDTIWKKLFYRILLTQVNGVASVSERCRKDFKQIFPYFNKPVAFAPIGIDLKAGMVNLRLNNDLPTGKRLLHVGHFSSEKNHKGLITIFADLLKRDAALQLILVGEGIQKDTIEQLVASKGISSHVHFLGKREDVLAIMQHCEALLLPSLIEGLPGVILEALSVRLPVVAYDVGGISEVVNENTGWLVEKDNEEAFSFSVMEVLDGDRMQVERKKNAGYELVASHYQNDQVVRYFEHLYQEVLLTNDQ